MALNSAPPSTIVEEFAQKIHKEQRQNKLMQNAPVLVLAFMVIFFSVTCPASFPTLYNLGTILNQLSITLLISVGLTFVILIGSVDLSVDGIVGLAGSVFSVIVLNSKNTNNLGLLGVLIAVAIGGLSGLITGFIHVKFKVPSFMVTYGICSIAFGFGLMSYGGHFAEIRDPVLTKIPATSFLGIPLITWIALVMAAIALYIQEKTPFGRYMYAVGTNETIPRMTGINVDRVKMMVFVWSGICLAMAGVLGALRLGRGEIAVGEGQYFPAQAAVVIGGNSLSGGKGGILNTVVGTLIITVLSDGLLLLGVNTYIRTGVQGLIILVAVAATVSRSSRTICK